MGRAIDETGNRYGRLVVISRASISSSRRERRWHCKCDCGGETISSGCDLRRGLSTSCGCVTKERRIASVLKHGDCVGGTETVEYRTWRQMRDRCVNPRNLNFPNYGGRGITVCERWQVFENFLADMGRRPVRKSIDRIDNDGNYEPSNCRWATPKEQAVNKRDGWIKRRMG